MPSLSISDLLSDASRMPALQNRLLKPDSNACSSKLSNAHHCLEDEREDRLHYSERQHHSAHHPPRTTHASSSSAAAPGSTLSCPAAPSRLMVRLPRVPHDKLVIGGYVPHDKLGGCPFEKVRTSRAMKDKTPTTHDRLGSWGPRLRRSEGQRMSKDIEELKSHDSPGSAAAEVITHSADE